jgi:tricorn protease
MSLISSKIIVMSYLSQPSLSQTHLYFISEEDLWRVPLNPAKDAMLEATRLTAGLGAMATPHVSPDGNWVALSSEEEGHCEVYVLSLATGELKRLTYLAAWSYPVGWKDGKTIVFKSNAKHAHRNQEFFQISIEGGLEEALNLGPGTNLSFRADGAVIFERNMHRPDPSHWKRYRGGTMGQLWFAKNLDSEFKRFHDLKGNLSCPQWVTDRIFYLSDESGLGRIYSCDENGKNQTAHAPSFKSEYYLRNLATNGTLLAAQSAGDLFWFDPKTDQLQKLNIYLPSHHVQKKRKVVSGGASLERFALQPEGHRMVISARGKVFHFAHWSGPVEKLGNEPAVRYKNPEWLGDGKRVVMVADDGLNETIEIHSTVDGSRKVLELKGLKDSIGRVIDMKVSPRAYAGAEWIGISNHRNELIIIQLETGEARLVHRNEHQFMGDFSWSPDTRFIAFSKSVSANRSCIAIYGLEDLKTHEVTKPLLEDFCPSFDPYGRHLYFLSRRVFNPIYDDVLFDMSFMKGRLPFLIVLQKNGANPFVRESVLPESLGRKPDLIPSFTELKCEIDFEGIQNRTLQFPVQEALYTRIRGTGKKVMWSYLPVEGTLELNPPAKAEVLGKEYLDSFDFETQTFEYFGTALTEFKLRPECGLRVMRQGNFMRLVKQDEKADETAAKDPSPKTGWVDLSRVQFMVEPREEWKQMFRDAWRMQKEFFWREDLNGVDWDAVYRRYEPVIDKVNCRREFSDVIWELIGELGTSHAYEKGGDYRGIPVFAIGLLGAEFKWQPSKNGYEVTRIYEGDRWNPKATSPLGLPGVNLKIGDVISKLDEVVLDESMTPAQACLNKAGREVRIEFTRSGNPQSERVLTRLMKDEMELRYREWVEMNRQIVKEKSKGRLGYIHIPNMVGKGYAEFHRNFLQEVDCEGLVVDVRFNGGGHVSQLLLDRLARRPIGKDESRWMGSRSIPFETPHKVVVALTNEYAGSDGDIFSHTFKLRKIGKLIGTRTWGGVVGIWPRHNNLDGGYTTQPEFATWFQDVKYGLENFGAIPDIEIEFAPHDHRKKHDPQLDRAISEAMKDL